MLVEERGERRIGEERSGKGSAGKRKEEKEAEIEKGGMKIVKKGKKGLFELVENGV